MTVEPRKALEECLAPLEARKCLRPLSDDGDLPGQRVAA
jgi:hypothetical protein